MSDDISSSGLEYVIQADRRHREEQQIAEVAPRNSREDEDEDEDVEFDMGPRPAKRTSGVITTAVSIILNVIGGGVLAISTGMVQTSFIPGIIMLVVMCAFNCLSIFALTYCTHNIQAYTYRAIVTQAFGAKFGRVFEALLFFYTFLQLIAYGRIPADSMPAVAYDLFKVASSSVLVSPTFWVLVSSVVWFGLSCARTLGGLWISSLLGFVTICIFGIAVIVRFADGTYVQDINANSTANSTANIHNASSPTTHHHSNTVHTSLISPDVEYLSMKPIFLSAVAVFTTAYNCMYNIPSFYGELTNRSPKQMYKTVTLAMGFIFAFYLMVGVLGYWTFGKTRIEGSEGNILNCYSRTDMLINAARFGYWIHFLTSFPLVALASRRALNEVIFGKGPEDMKRWTLCLESFLLVGIASTLALFIKSIDVIFAINGSLFGIPIVVVIPPLLAARVVFDPRKRNDDGFSAPLVAGNRALGPIPPCKVRYYICIGVTVAGVILSIMCFVVTVIDIS